MASHRSNTPKRTHADLLGGATQAYADHLARLRTVAQAAADETRRRQESATVATTTRTRTAAIGQPAKPNER